MRRFNLPKRHGNLQSRLISGARAPDETNWIATSMRSSQ
jgi:hypothetical protein